jgi:hypothetical protein
MHARPQALGPLVLQQKTEGVLLHGQRSSMPVPASPQAASVALPVQNNIILHRHLELLQTFQQHMLEDNLRQPSRQPGPHPHHPLGATSEEREVGELCAGLPPPLPSPRRAADGQAARRAFVGARHASHPSIPAAGLQAEAAPPPSSSYARMSELPQPNAGIADFDVWCQQMQQAVARRKAAVAGTARHRPPTAQPAQPAAAAGPPPPDRGRGRRL